VGQEGTPDITLDRAIVARQAHAVDRLLLPDAAVAQLKHTNLLPATLRVALVRQVRIQLPVALVVLTVLCCRLY